MSLFRGYSEEDFLDEDEIRLRRESKKRNSNAHSSCEADHKDDGRYAYTTKSRPHEDCEADHSDDNSRPVNPVFQNGNPTNPLGIHNVKLVSLVVFLVVFVSFFASFAIVIGSLKASTSKMEEASISISEQQEIIRDATSNYPDENDQEIIGAILRRYNRYDLSRREIVNMVVEEDGYDRGDVERIFMITQSTSVFNFKEKALNRLLTFIEEEEDLSETKARTMLEEAGFTANEIDYAIENSGEY